ncbi:MAG: PDZ domain-containing protein [Pseudomonadota bacterium]
MKQLMLVCLLAMSAAAFAQTSTQPDPKRAGKNSEIADVELSRPDVAKREAEEAKTRANLDAARARLDKAAREVAELSGQLGRNARRDVFFVNADDHRGVLGVQVDNDSDHKGARVLHVSPGGPAEEAGLRDGDVIISLDGQPMSGDGDASRRLVDQMRRVKPEQKLKVRVVRAGKNKDFVVVARPMVFESRMFNVQMPDMAGPMGGVSAVGGSFSTMPMIQQFRGFFAGEFGGMELASLTPKLGAYFGVNDGVLVVKAPESDVFKLEDGDVIQSIGGRKPDDGAHAMRILRSYGTGEKLNLTVLRQRKSVTLDITMPERPEFGGDNFHFEGPMPPAPGMPPPPGAPRVPGGPGTL